MYLKTTSPVGQFTSPFGSHVHIATGMVTEISVNQAYWLLGHPEVDVTFASPEEEAECARLVALSKFNPLKEVPTPQSLTPNATLQLDGASTRYPVIVVNPEGLVSEYQGTYEFGKPQLNLVFDREMVRQVMEEFFLTPPTSQVIRPVEPAEVTEDELEKLTAPDVTELQVTPVDGEAAPVEEAPPVGEAETVTPPAETGDSESSGTSKGRGRKTISDEDI